MRAGIKGFSCFKIETTGKLRIPNEFEVSQVVETKTQARPGHRETEDGLRSVLKATIENNGKGKVLTFISSSIGQHS